MSVMTKKQNKPVKAVPPPATTVPTTVELSVEHAAALNACVKRERRTKRAIIELALEEYLSKRQLWPPPEEE